MRMNSAQIKVLVNRCAWIPTAIRPRFFTPHSCRAFSVSSVPLRFALTRLVDSGAGALDDLCPAWTLAPGDGEKLCRRAAVDIGIEFGETLAHGR